MSTPQPETYARWQRWANDYARVTDLAIADLRDTKQTRGQPSVVPPFTLADLGTPTNDGVLVLVTDAVGGPQLAVSFNGNWYINGTAV